MKITDAVKKATLPALILLIASLLAAGVLVAPVLAQHAGHGGAPAQSPAAEPEDEEEGPIVDIPLDKQQLIGVKTVAAEVRPLHKTIRTVGRVAYNERRLATINTKFEGWIETLHADYAGKYVKKGEPLAELYSPELLATQQEFLSLIAGARGGNTTGRDDDLGRLRTQDTEAIIAGARERLRLFDITDEQIRQIEQTGKAVRTLTIHSPVNGYVIRKMAFQGTRVMPGDALFDVADLSTVWIISDIYEYELSLVREGQKARISLSYFPGREFVSPIEYVYPTLSGETRTAKVRFTIPNPGGRLMPQMFTNVEVKINLGRRLAIPEDAVIDTGVRQVVYVDQGDGYFEHRVVTLGLRADGMVEVLKGLAAGENVASAAVFLIDSEAKLRGIVQ
ncbi:MAG TPA: efflux RND transporter periplasmic adaptor subunit [Nitrospirota bacterium]|jgi:Cu(I)/Ag(I) efflux system membrane fusion protein